MNNLFLLYFLNAQRVVQGKVVGADGLALKGVSVKVLNKSIAVPTDENGAFSIKADANDVLVFSYLGFKTVQEKVNGRTAINITLEADESQLNEVTVLGSRAVGRVNVDKPVPVDVFDVQKLSKEVPQTNINQILNYIAPSFSSNTQTIADGTDHVDPAQLRGLGPDQVLVLVNGKRRHTSALVNINGSPGRGSVGTDMNALPSFAVNKLEVLRDGAAAQYGSDAIAGVINLNMKRSVNQLTGQVNAGSNSYNGHMDGQALQVDLNYGLPLGKKGFINFTGSSQFRGATNRAGVETNTIYNAYNAVEYRAMQGGLNMSSLFANINNTPNTAQIISGIKQYAPQVGYLSAATQSNIANATTITQLQGILNQDVTFNELAYRRLNRSDFNMRVGQSKLASGQFFVNGELPLSDIWTLYAFGGISYRDGLSAGFYRKPNQSRSYTGLYPNGFLPEIASTIADYSMATGIKGKFGKDIYVDLSNTWGKNKFGYGVENTVNTTLGMTSPTSFNAGALAFSQNTTNLDLSKPLSFWDSNIAIGGEMRLENYSIIAGNPNSYLSYDINGNPVTATTATNLLTTDFFGNVRPGGAQVFPGYRDANAFSKGRTSYAGYVDYELNPTKWWLIDLAARAENYSDFGSTFNYKIATRFKVSDKINLRAAYNTGFRAPSLAQIYFNATSTQFTGGIPYEVGTFSNDSQVAKLLGIPKLKQETSDAVSAGFSVKIPEAHLTLSVDGYVTNIQNRVVLTDSFNKPSGTFAAGTPEKALQDLFTEANATTATFFANAIDTRTKGLDIVISNRNKWGEVTLNNDFALNVNNTERVGDIHASDVLRAAGQVNQYYSEATRIYLTTATPRIKFNLSHSLTYGKLNVFLRNAFFGAVTDPNTTDVNGDGIISASIINGQAIETEHPVYAASIVTDLSFTYNFPHRIGFTIGANNIFDQYPGKVQGPIYTKRPSGIVNGAVAYANAPVMIDLSSNDQFKYSRNTSQFGASGRYIFLRMTYGF